MKTREREKEETLQWLAGVETPRVLCNYLVVTLLSLADRAAAVAQTGRPDRKEDRERNALYT